MKYYLVLIFMTLTLSVWGTSCSDDAPIPETGQQIPPGSTDDDEPPVNPGNDDDDDDNPMSNNLKITVGSASFNATLENNAAATAFKALLPQTRHVRQRQDAHRRPGPLLYEVRRPRRNTRASRRAAHVRACERHDRRRLAGARQPHDGRSIPAGHASAPLV